MSDLDRIDTVKEEKQSPWMEAVKVSVRTVLVFVIAMAFVATFIAMFFFKGS